MPSFAELRAKAEAAANSAKETASSKLAEHRGEKKPEKPVYKPPPPRPAFKPAPPPDSNRPKPAGYDVEEEEHVSVNQRQPLGRASLGSMAAQRISNEVEGKGIEVLLQNKELFFNFLDEFFAAKGLDVYSRAPVSREPDQVLEGQEVCDRGDEEADEYTNEQDESHEEEPGTPTETTCHPQQEEIEVPEPVSPPPPPSRRPPPLKAKPPTRSSGEQEEAPAPVPKPPRRLPPIAHKPTHETEATSDNVVVPGRTIPPASSSPKPSTAVQAIFANLHRPTSDTMASTTQAAPVRPIRRSVAPVPTISSSAMIPFTTQSPVQVQEEGTPPPQPFTSKSGRLSKLPKTSSPSVSSSPSSEVPAPPPVPQSTRPPPVNRASRPTPPPSQRHVSTSMTNVVSRSDQMPSNRVAGIGAPPSMFFTGEANEEWTPPLPYGYMPSAGRKATEGQCSAAQLCSYFAVNVPWDSWYSVEDTVARPASIVDLVEARWKGSVMYSQETKKRLFGAGKTATERSRIGVVTFQDLSIAWYRVTWKEEDPIKSLKREARYRATPSSWNGDKLYAAHLLYGQAITDFCERAIRMRQFVGGGGPWDLVNGALTSLAKYKPNAPPVIPSIGHCHGHLIYEGYVDQGTDTMWGITRGGETAIRNGDIIEWCDVQIQIQDEDEEVTIFTFPSGYTSVILSAVEFPERLDEDAQTLPPTRLPDLEIVMQSAASNMLPSRRLALLRTLVKGRIWIFRPVGWDYVGLSVEPDADWPPPDPTLFLPT